jgi:PAS domain S-box-containing protein
VGAFLNTRKFVEYLRRFWPPAAAQPVCPPVDAPGTVHLEPARVSVFWIVFQIAFVMFAVEGLIMVVLLNAYPFLQPMGTASKWTLALVDSLALVSIAGPVIYWWVVRPYISAQRRADSTLRDAIESISEGFTMYDADDRLVLCNSQLRALYPGIADVLVPGYSFEEILRTGMTRGEYPEAAGREEEWIAERVKRHSEPKTPSERLTASGRWVKILETRTADGSTVGIRTDITDLKARELQLRESEERYRRLIELSPDGIMVYRNGRVLYCNATLAKIFGAEDRQQIIGRDVLAFSPNDDHAKMTEPRARVSHEETLGIREATSRRLDGSLVSVERTVAAVSWQGEPAFLALVRDITERKTREHRFRQIADALQEGFVLYDAEDRLVVWNEKWLELHRDIYDAIGVGVTFEALLRLKIARKLLPDAYGREEDFIAERIADHNKPHEPLLRQTHDGRWYVIRETRTETGGIFALNIDITDLKNAETVAEEARLQAEQAARVKSKFLANMSHELRTPLNAVIGFSDLIKKQMELNISADSIPAYIDAIHSSGQHLLSLINDLLDFSKIEAGKMELHENEVSLTDLFADLSEQVATQIENAGLRISLPDEPCLPIVLGDELRLRQILLNLLSNAIKFTPEGGDVCLLVAQRDDGGLALSVRDTGIGMTNDVLCELGEPFRQFGTTSAPTQAGTGLGVSIAIALADMHDGRMVYESEPDKGTTATLILPAHRVLPIKSRERAAG